MSTPQGVRALRAAAAKVEALTAPVFDALDALAAFVQQHLNLSRYPVFSDPSAWDTVEPAAARLLHDHPLATGSGLALLSPAGDALPSMAWWVLRSGEVRAKQHVFNPRSDSFYDVSEARWFRLPLRTGQRTLLAPYVDSWGTDDATMTASAPLLHQGRVAGVVAADLDARQYLTAVERLLADAGSAALLDEEDRVIASSLPHLESGARLAAVDARPAPGDVPVPAFGWRVARIEG